MFNQKSDLNKVHDFEERRQQACKRSKLDYDIIKEGTPEIHELIFHYHISQSSLKYQSLCTDQQLFYRIQQQINSPIEDSADVEAVLKKRTELSNLSRELLIRIDTLYSEIFATKDVTEHAERHIREMLTPEKRLKMNGEVK